MQENVNYFCLERLSYEMTTLLGAIRCIISVIFQSLRSFLQKCSSCLCETGLVQKAKKAKDKLLKRDGDDRPDTGSYESFYYGGVDPYMWEPQELGGTENDGLS